MSKREGTPSASEMLVAVKTQGWSTVRPVGSPHPRSWAPWVLSLDVLGVWCPYVSGTFYIKHVCVNSYQVPSVFYDI